MQKLYFVEIACFFRRSQITQCPALIAQMAHDVAEKSHHRRTSLSDISRSLQMSYVYEEITTDDSEEILSGEKIAPF